MKPHIVWAHGLNCTSKVFSYFRSVLPKHKTTLIEYDSYQSIDVSVDEVVSQLPNEPFIFIGHSLGGVIGKIIAVRKTDDIKMEKIISISSPFGGSEFANRARWFYPTFRILHDLCRNSSDMQTSRLESDVPHVGIISMNGNFPFIPGPNDGVVSIASQKMCDFDRCVEVDANHFEVLQDSTVTSVIMEEAFK